MRKTIFSFAVAFVATSLFAEWETDRWTQVMGVSFEGYASGERLDETNGVHYGHWTVSDGAVLADAGSAMKNGDVTYMHIQSTTNLNLSFVADRAGRTGGGNVLLFSVQTTARSGSSMADLPPDSKGGFAVAAGEGEVPASFLGWTADGWRKLESAAVQPMGDAAWYDVAMRFRVAEGGRVQVQYLVKSPEGRYEVLSDADRVWLDTSVENGDASVGAVDFFGVGGLERLSSREKNGFSVRLR